MSVVLLAVGVALVLLPIAKKRTTTRRVRCDPPR